jgi:hypothetical protein
MNYHCETLYIGHPILEAEHLKHLKYSGFGVMGVFK